MGTGKYPLRLKFCTGGIKVLPGLRVALVELVVALVARWPLVAPELRRNSNFAERWESAQVKINRLEGASYCRIDQGSAFFTFFNPEKRNARTIGI